MLTVELPRATIKIFGVAEQEQGEYIYRKRMAEGKVTHGVKNGSIDR